MKAYIQSDKNYIPHNDNFYRAYLAFKEMGIETVMFHTKEEMRTSNKEDIIIGYVGTVRERLHDFGIIAPEMDYPEELQKYLGRRVWESTIDTVNNSPEMWPVFVKSKVDKAFTGVVVNSPKDLINCGKYDSDQEAYCSEVVEFVTEWRCFVRYGRIIDVRHYKGDWRKHFDPEVIENCIKDYTTAPAGVAVDFGLTKDGRTLLIEVNDGYALGSYGLYYPDYAKLLSARWAELTETEDECDFMLEKYNRP